MSAHRARAIGLIAVLLSAWLVLAGAATAQAAVVINEFMANNTKTKQDEDGQFDDWIELFNTSTANASVGGYYMSDQASQPRKWKIPAGTDMGGQQRLLIWADGTSPSLPTRPLHAAFRLNAENGELIALYDDKGTTIDVVRFGQQAPDISYGRITDGASRWVPLNKPNPLGANGTGGYIPPPSRLLGVHFINEWLSSNTAGIRDNAGNREDWIELHNSATYAIDLGGYYLTDNLTNLRKWEIPAGNVIGPGGFALFWADDDEDEGPTHANFKLSDEGEDIAILEKNATDLLSGRIDVVSYGPQRANVSRGRLPDGGAAFTDFSEPTPRESNPTRARSWWMYR